MSSRVRLALVLLAAVAGFSSPAIAAVYYYDLADSSVTVNRQLDLVPGWSPASQPWEFSILNGVATQTFLTPTQYGVGEPGNRVLAQNDPICVGAPGAPYLIVPIPLAEGEIIESHPMPTGSFLQMEVPYWSKGGQLRQGPENCTSGPQYYSAPTAWELLAPGTRRYVGLLLFIDGEIHYGWLGMNVGSLLVDDFAYEEVPGRAIAAGDTVPEPDAMLAAWAATVALAACWRSRTARRPAASASAISAPRPQLAGRSRSREA